jgi:hypothetical protein
MELSDRPRPLTIGLYFAVASFLLYLGIGISALVPAPPDESRFAQAILPLLFVLLALLLTFRLAWILRRPGSPQSKRRRLWLTLPISLAGVFLGSVLSLCGSLARALARTGRRTDRSEVAWRPPLCSFCGPRIARAGSPTGRLSSCLGSAKKFSTQPWKILWKNTKVSS